MDQREQALMEQRLRIMQSAQRMLFVNFSPARVWPNLRINVEIEAFRTETIDTANIKLLAEAPFVNGTIDASIDSCEIISDKIYSIIASNYPNRNINITVTGDNDTGVTIKYNLTKPYQQLAI
jgi:hypothetical protein